MTPAERDEVLRIATSISAGKDPVSIGSPLATTQSHAMLTLATFVLRYVPPGDAAAPHPWRVRHDGCGMVAITLDALVVAMEPDVARRLAHAIHAAADAAEENDR